MTVALKQGRAWIASTLVAIAAFLPGNRAQAQAVRWQSAPGYRVAELSVPKPGKTGFALLPASETGVRFTNVLTMQVAGPNQNLLNGSGVAAGDYDGDGLVDFYLCNKVGRNALYHNLGNWRFEDVTEKAGVLCPGMLSTGALWGDVDGDGQLDLLVTGNNGPNALFLNLGNGRFTNITAAAGLASRPLGATSLGLADIDGNGTLDLYVVNYGENTVLRSGAQISYAIEGGKPRVRGRYATRVAIIDGKMMDLGEPHTLYLNDGKLRFTPLPWLDGTWFKDENGQPLRELQRDMGLSVAFRDLNEDLAPDLYVCNDFQNPDRIWINDGKGHFQAIPRLAFRHTPHFSMGLDFADINRDGKDDLIVADMLSRSHPLVITQIAPTNPPISFTGEAKADRPQYRRNHLFLNRGDGTYAEIADFAGVSASDWTWCPVFVDVDLDGYEDLLMVTGHAFDTQDMDTSARNRQLGRMGSVEALMSYPPFRTPNVIFRNRGNLTFEEVGTQWGFDSREVSQGIALADLDNDGDLDVIINTLNGPALVYRNESAAPRIAVRLKGKSPNTHGIGAKIKVLGGAVPFQSQEMMASGRYLSGDDNIRTFAAGTASNLTIEVLWRSGLRSTVKDARPNCIYELDESAAAPFSRAKPAEPPPLFKDVSAAIKHEHVDEPFNDFARQPLLHRVLSTSGPGTSWGDLDGDGHDDLVITSGKGGQTAVYRGDGKGNFSRVQSPALSAPAARDQTTALIWTPEQGRRGLLVGSANYEEGGTAGESVQSLVWQNGALVPGAGLPGQAESSGALAVADVDGDGNLDLFVGGRVLPGRYAEAAPSRLYRHMGGKLQPDPQNSAVLAPPRGLGLVVGAVFSDLNNDGWPDLVLACEWGPVRVFLNHKGILREATEELGLAGYSGWWSGVTTGDLDGDGRLDIIAGNFGLNNPYQASPQQPIRLYYGDADGNGTVDLIEAYFDALTLRKIVPRRQMDPIMSALPFVAERQLTHKTFGEMSVSELLGDKMGRLKEAQASTLASMVFFNRGNRFEALPLPPEAQFSCVYSVSVGDMDGDGSEDVFLSQNFFGFHAEMPRLDAGRGLWLRGDGQGGLAPVPGQASGVTVWEEQRGAALSDFNEDGRVDLVVSQHAGPTVLYANVGAKPGLRVRLEGPPGNPTGVGASLRVVFGQRTGPAREVHAGSGYWSQDSAVQVMGLPEPPTQVQVRWPGGRQTTTAVPPGATGIVVRP